jgi:hypothetical protein
VVRPNNNTGVDDENSGSAARGGYTVHPLKNDQTAGRGNGRAFYEAILQIDVQKSRTLGNNGEVHHGEPPKVELYCQMRRQSRRAFQFSFSTESR